MPTPFLGSNIFETIPTIQINGLTGGDPLTVSASGTIPSLTGGSGAPSGVPAYGTGSIYYDITNYDAYIYEASAWHLIGDNNVVISISTATTAGTAPNIQYIYLVSGTTTLTLPTAVGNSSIYTVKNVGSGTVTIATTSSQTIDGSLTAVLKVKYTSLTLVSDNANWNII